MSMETVIHYGFGFNCDCSAEKFKEFVKNNAGGFCRSADETKLYKLFLERINAKDENGKLKKLDESELEDVIESTFESYSCQTSGAQGAGAVISNIMSRTTGIRFAYYGADSNCETYPAIIFRESYPWDYNEEEKSLTKEKLESFCKECMDSLGIEGEPDFLKQEYYG